MILIEQYVHRALAFGDECLVLERGEVAWIAPPAQRGMRFCATISARP